jgi:hypothetical protein
MKNHPARSGEVVDLELATALSLVSGANSVPQPVRVHIMRILAKIGSRLLDVPGGRDGTIMLRLPHSPSLKRLVAEPSVVRETPSRARLPVKHRKGVRYESKFHDISVVEVQLGGDRETNRSLVEIALLYENANLLGLRRVNGPTAEATLISDLKLVPDGLDIRRSCLVIDVTADGARSLRRLARVFAERPEMHAITSIFRLRLFDLFYAVSLHCCAAKTITGPLSGFEAGRDGDAFVITTTPRALFHYLGYSDLGNNGYVRDRTRLQNRLRQDGETEELKPFTILSYDFVPGTHPDEMLSIKFAADMDLLGEAADPAYLQESRRNLFGTDEREVAALWNLDVNEKAEKPRGSMFGVSDMYNASHIPELSLMLTMAGLAVAGLASTSVASPLTGALVGVMAITCRHIVGGLLTQLRDTSNPRLMEEIEGVIRRHEEALSKTSLGGPHHNLTGGGGVLGHRSREFDVKQEQKQVELLILALRAMERSQWALVNEGGAKERPNAEYLTRLREVTEQWQKSKNEE